MTDIRTSPTWLRATLISVGGLLILGLIGGLIWWLVGRFTGQPQKEQKVTQVTLMTTDGVTIVGDLYRPADKPLGGILLIHMMPATKESWQDFAGELTARGYLALAIDLRGHGASTRQGDRTLNYQLFSDTEHQNSRLDIAAALDYLQTNEQIPVHQLGLVGASIGANLALEALANNRNLRWAVLLSPGFDYRGIETEPLIRKIAPTQRLLLVASEEDSYSAQTIQRLGEIAPAPTTTTVLSDGGHGTDMFNRDPDLMAKVLEWITQRAH